MQVRNVVVALAFGAALAGVANAGAAQPSSARCDAAAAIVRHELGPQSRSTLSADRLRVEQGQPAAELDHGWRGETPPRALLEQFSEVPASTALDCPEVKRIAAMGVESAAATIPENQMISAIGMPVISSDNRNAVAVVITRGAKHGGVRRFVFFVRNGAAWTAAGSKIAGVS
jgi:hypothetical protein